MLDLFSERWKTKHLCVPYGKGQIISKGLFVVLESSQKTNERIRCSSKNEFVCSFFGRIRGYQKSFRNYLTFRWTEIFYVLAAKLILKKKTFDPLFKKKLLDYLISSKSLPDFHSILFTHLPYFLK